MTEIAEKYEQEVEKSENLECSDLPSDVSVDIADIPVINFFKRHRSMQIFITEVHSPLKFWFRNADDDTKIQIFEKKLHDFYRKLMIERNFTYKMSENDAIEGRLCATLFSATWHRAVIIRGPVDNKVEVMYIDYGTIGTVPVDKLHFLTSKFAKFPYVLMRGRLALVAPKGNHHWKRNPPKSDTNEFEAFITGRKLTAFLYAKEKDENVHHLILYEPPVKFAKQHASVNERFALMTDCQLFTMDTEEWPCLDELYPNFDILENNQFPTHAKLAEARNDESFWQKEEIQRFYSETYQWNKRLNRVVYSNPLDECFAETRKILAERKTIDKQIQ
ncbi:uncharacterized protein LOC134834781 isoform X2 [Culicoides brevitarsis]|uniref:uncharacterized protein LOC134834781 isoform X2 n=1 Tax=Culicoides brevitarsis TaxID=469753 RepID=UPI00307C0996